MADLIGVVARSRFPQEERRAEHAPRVPILDSIKRHPRQMLLAIGVAFGHNTLACIGSIFTMTSAEELGYDYTESLLLQVAGSIAFTVAVPLMARLSDRVGRTPVVILGTLAYGAFFFACFPMVNGHVLALATVAYVLVNVLTAAPQGCIPAFLGEQFPGSTRYSSISATYQTGAALGGGTAATAATALLLAFDGDPIGVGLYSGAAAVVLALCAWGLRETFKVPTAELGSATTADRGAKAAVDAMTG
ncbi:MFS transporter [Streptomyces sp. NPDC058430]|uniref:MFS transporter n=1 Tax=Streptomyces sp. NPDC058430 TaxID=3346495 RepID=UPI003661CBD9